MITCYYCGNVVMSPFNAVIFKRRHIHIAHRTCRKSRLAERKTPNRHHPAPIDANQENQAADVERYTSRDDRPITPFLKPDPVAEAKEVAVAAEASGDQLSLSLAKLERLSEAIFPKAVKGDLEAVNLAVTIEKRRAELLGLDARDRRASLQSTQVEKEVEPHQEQNLEPKNGPDEDSSRRERFVVSRIPKIR
jgi:hypothetical protein